MATNFEFWKDEILRITMEHGSYPAVINDKPSVCSEEKCTKCLGGAGCYSKIFEWLYEEHTEKPKLTRTRQDLILEAFPNVKLVDGCINVCTYNFKMNPECRGSEGCSKCMRDFWLAPAEGEENNGLEKDHQR